MQQEDMSAASPYGIPHMLEYSNDNLSLVPSYSPSTYVEQDYKMWQYCSVPNGGGGNMSTTGPYYPGIRYAVAEVDGTQRPTEIPAGFLHEVQSCERK